jgi:hypothetical protein
MANPFRYSIYFRIRHPSMAVTGLADCLPNAPQWNWQVGEARRTPKGSPLAGVYRDSYCTFDLGGGEDGEVAKHILRALEGLTPKRDFIRNVSTTGGSAAFYVYWYPNGDTGEVFEAPLLSALGESGIALMLNVYDDRETLGRRLSAATVTDLVQNFAEACRALVPALDRAEVAWRDKSQYDNWDRIAVPLFETLVLEPCVFAAVGETGLSRLQVARYGFVDAEPEWNAYIALEGATPKRVVGLSSNVAPFDSVVFSECSTGRVATLALTDARFVFVFAALDGTQQRLTIVPFES